MTNFNYLIGKEIKKYELEGDTCLKFFLKDNEIVEYTAYGDCCSESFFHSINGISFLNDCKVLKVVEKKEIDAPGSYQEEDVLYGVDLLVEKENKNYNVEIEFRNSSNGYYGGWVEGKIFDENGHIIELEDF